MIYMSLIDVIGLGVSSILLIILSKNRFHIRNGCCSYSYNEHVIDKSKLSADDIDSDYDDLPIDSEDNFEKMMIFTTKIHHRPFESYKTNSNYH